MHVPETHPGHCATCGIPVQLMDGDTMTGTRVLPVVLEATGMVAYVPPNPLAPRAEWQVRLTYPLHPPRCRGAMGRLPGGTLPR